MNSCPYCSGRKCVYCGYSGENKLAEFYREQELKKYFEDKFNKDKPE